MSILFRESFHKRKKTENRTIRKKHDRKIPGLSGDICFGPKKFHGSD